ncbi:dihydrosphingosine 1-phosphate phosphatase [Entomortierella parvispora]|uniref:Dihydrosphingosine 1-phosphate phosphatase n=1 Tax=Entomortierella parvispora TaxID=205924 RepID=A0A9P3HHW4_9FUNG|nr:dihydrosphingosine 1-phosphate phosphatase [Entomortierella parvispora]
MADRPSDFSSKESTFIVVNGADDRDAGIYSDSFYSQRMSLLRHAIRRRMLPWVRSETQFLAALQARWRTPLLDSYFTLTAFAGHPLFFVCILPIMFWYGHSVFARGFVNVACMGVFVTSWVKDYLCLPRPLSPPLVRLSRSKRVHLEYGFPSTHTSNATSIALYLLSYLLISDWSIQAKILSIIGLIIYLFSIIFGRLYCGMHTQTDIFGGTVIGIVVWAVQWAFHDSIDELMTRSSWTVVFTVVLGGIVLIQSIPETMDSCPCVDDGVTTMAVLMGVFPASQHFAQSKYSITAAGHAGIVSYDPALGLPRSILRFVFGLAVVFTWRLAAKKLLYIVLPPLYSYFNFPSRTHFVPAKTYGNLRRQPIGRVPSVMDLQALSDSSIEIVGTQSTMDIHEQFSQTRSSNRSGVLDEPENVGVEKREHFVLRPSHSAKAKLQQQQLQDGSTGKPSLTNLENLDDEIRSENKELDECERAALEKFEAEHPGWARFDVDIVIKTVVYAGIGWLAVDSIPIMFEYIGLGTSLQR